MITIIICGIIGIVIACRIEYKSLVMYDMQGELGLYILSSFLGAIIGVGVGIGIAFLLPSKSYQKQEYNKIVSLQDNGSISGSFFLGSGSINGSMEYSYYYQRGNYFILRQVPCNKASIQYADTPTVVECTWLPDTTYKMNWFSFSSDWGENFFVFQIPKGSIKNDFTLDAK